jgi:DNA polymerase/3'-5' exonuclease PolX
LAKRYGELADALDEIATHLRVTGDGRIARDYEIAASELRTMEEIPMDPSEADGISENVRDSIGEWRAYGEIDKLQEFREKRPHVSNLTKIKSIGPKRAQKIHEETGASDIEDIRELDENGELEDVSGIGTKTATTIRRSIAQL